MLAYLDKISTDYLELARLIVFWLFIAANAGVVAGVVLEREKNSHATKENGWWLLVISLGLEIFFSSVTFGIDLEIGRRQKMEIAALEKKFVPRVLNESQRLHITKQFEGEPQSAKVFSINPTFEAMNLANLIAAALSAANWKIDRAAEPDMGPLGGVGVAIFSSRRTTFKAAILKSILEYERITSYVLPAKRCASETDPAQARFAAVDPSCNRMVIVVGDHP
jgi:hypothetical protein